jgi:hypothetical protein
MLQTACFVRGDECAVVCATSKLSFTGCLIIRTVLLFGLEVWTDAKGCRESEYGS